MSFIRKTFEVMVCDRCGRQLRNGPTTNGRRNERKVARGEGWTTRWGPSRSRQDWCAECSRGF